MAEPSNRARGDANYQALVAYFDRIGASIPCKADGTADIASIVREAPLSSRGIIYQNARNRALCDERFALHKIPPIADRKTDGATFQRPGAVVVDEETKQLRQRNSQLERDLLVARGELFEVRRQMRRFEAIDMHMAESGRLPR